MASAYKCDLCRKYADDCYAMKGIDIGVYELRKMGIDQDKKHEVKEVCEECYGKIMDVVIGLFKKEKSTTN